MLAFRELARAPDPTGTRLLLDGVHLVREAHDCGIDLEAVAVAAGAADVSEEAALARELGRRGVQVFEATEQAFAAMSPVRAPSGIVGIAARRDVAAETICRRPDAFVLVAVDVQDPGNVGAMIRAGEAGGVTGVLVCGASATPFSWKAVRGSMGSILRLPVVAGLSPDAAVDCVRAAGVRVIAAAPRGGRPPEDVDWSGRVALLLGGEGAGLPDRVVAAADERVTIPMAAPVESLNLAVAAGILIYAARHRRQ